jgi:hypothetical protein
MLQSSRQQNKELPTTVLPENHDETNNEENVHPTNYYDSNPEEDNMINTDDDFQHEQVSPAFK